MHPNPSAASYTHSTPATALSTSADNPETPDGAPTKRQRGPSGAQPDQPGGFTYLDKDGEPGRRKIRIEYIGDKSRRHITFSKRKAGIMKKVRLSRLGSWVILSFPCCQAWLTPAITRFSHPIIPTSTSFTFPLAHHSTHRLISLQPSFDSKADDRPMNSVSSLVPRYYYWSSRRLVWYIQSRLRNYNRLSRNQKERI